MTSTHITTRPDDVIDGAIEWLRKNLQGCGDRVMVYSPALQIVLDELDRLRRGGENQ